MSENAARRRVLLITTGGTITMIDDGAGGLEPAPTVPAFLRLLPELDAIAELETVNAANMDSANARPDLWRALSELLYARYDDFDGFVITHGTDTLVYTAAALSFMLQGLGKPVVLTGAQVPLVEVGTDARSNLVSAVRVAISDVAGVCVAFGSLVIRGTRARKTSAFDLQAFRAVNDLPIGEIGLTLRLAPQARRRSLRRPVFTADLCTEVARLPAWPGMSPDLLRHVAATHRGVVLEGYGVGTLPSEGDGSLVPAIRDAVDAGVPVVVSTQCMVGSTAMERYRVGRSALDAGAIPAMDMTPECAQVKLMWALARVGGASCGPVDVDRVKALMLENFEGELMLEA